MAEVVEIDRGMRGKDQPPRTLIAKLAAEQQGVIARWQLLDMGFTRWAIDRMIASGYLHPLHRGVYAVGHRNVSRGAWVMAAVLLYGPEALASHVAGAWAWGLLRGPGGRIDVTVVGSGGARRKGIRVHRARDLHPHDRTIHHGIPVTSVARVLLDIAAGRPHLLRRVFEESERKRVIDLPKVHAAIDSYRGHHGCGRLARLVDETTGPPPRTRSEIEDAFAQFLREEGFPMPEWNAMIGEYEVDAVWWKEKVIAEIDHYSTHGHRTAFERDRIRDAELHLMKFRPIRVTDAQIVERVGLARRLHGLLGV
jgi:very-short-patch-repair endonuclease